MALFAASVCAQSEEPRKQVEHEAAQQQPDERQLKSQMNEFAAAWNKLMQGCEKGVWDAKKAREARKAFDRLVASPAWQEKTHPE